MNGQVHKTWVVTVGNITRYIKERDSASYQIISSSNQLIEIKVEDELGNTIFNYPLSAHVKIPNEWNYVRTEQDGVIYTLTTIATDTGRVVLTKVVPDNGILKLTPVNPTAVEMKFKMFITFSYIRIIQTRLTQVQ